MAMLDSLESTTYRINGMRRALAETLALEASKRYGKVVKASAIINYIIDQGLTLATVEKYVEERKEKDKQLAAEKALERQLKRAEKEKERNERKLEKQRAKQREQQEKKRQKQS